MNKRSMRVLGLVTVFAIAAAASLLSQSSPADARTFKAVFTLMAQDALLTDESLTLSGVHSQVLVVDSEGTEAVGVTAAAPFLER
jgi:hypothetical protein